MTDPNDKATGFAYNYDKGDSVTGGLTKREYFAAMALQGVLASCVNADPHAGTAATMAVEYADALIEALNK